MEAINQNQALSPSWVFKGGTCLKKCYFETYRFSEDLDFTLTDESHLDPAFLQEQFESISDWLNDTAGIDLPGDRFVFDVYENPRGRLSCEGRLYYRSHFTKSQKNLPKIKLDLTADEVLVLPPSTEQIVHPYSDEPSSKLSISCYAYPEVFGEKVRALGERGRPRDLYDVINLFRNDKQPSYAVIQDVLQQKCAYKGIAQPTFTDIEQYRNALEANWAPMLDHQLPSLPDLDIYWDALPSFFEWLEGRGAQESVRLDSVPGEGEVYRPVYGRLGLNTRSGASLEIVRFAAGNRLLVDLDYTDLSGKRSRRLIEPYSLRSAGTGNVLLYSVRADNGQIRAYIVDHINEASVTNQTFVPRYQIELTPEGGAPIETVGNLRSLNTPRRDSLGGQRRRSVRTSPLGPTYVYRCPMCDKKFRRKSNNSILKPHKTKDGYPCSGRRGFLDDTVY
ncbi:MAG: nucleotidyl transferase AbiEii/AbiGii toxin family protein [Pseudomonadales bacterium]|nr:nucleotidyl transferase AbiEii/AbiGii toxin family protein [Pseudomonadales bacterium]